MVRVMTDEDARKLAAELRTFKEAFHMRGSEVVTVERTGRHLLEMARLDDLIERLERPTAKQMSLFDPKNRP
jgi:hypothetical protein